MKHLTLGPDMFRRTTQQVNYALSRNERILTQLRKGEESASNLALSLDCPVASVRRSIQELRALGHNISFSGMGSSELYRLGE